MFPKDFEKFITNTHLALLAKHPHKDARLDVLGRTVKIAEEFGELASEVLTSLQLQRKSKLTRARRVHLENEWADTFFSLVLLALTLDLPIKDSVTRRIQRITSRVKNKKL